MLFSRRVVITGTGLAAAAVALSDRRSRDWVLRTAEGSVRFARAATYSALVLADYHFSLNPIETAGNKDTEEWDAAKSAVDARSAARLLHVCRKHGGIYTKFGQSLSSSYGLPSEYTETLKVLQDRAATCPYELIKVVLEEDLGRPPSEIFSCFDENPIAAASLAQVHRAVLRDGGAEVAVKLQYPYLRRQVDSDLRTMRVLLRIMEWVDPSWGYTWLVPEFEASIRNELSFVQEAHNAERCAAMFARNPRIHIPTVYRHLTTDRVLVMEFIHGARATDKAALAAMGVKPLDVAGEVSRFFGDQIHVHGFLHCDPHAGNLMVRRDAGACTDGWSVPASDSSTTAPPSSSSSSTTSTLVPPGTSTATLTAAAAAGTPFATIATTTPTAPVARSPNWQLVILDHGMYRRLNQNFKNAYNRLWESLVLRDEPAGRRACVELGLTADHYEALSLMLVYRPPQSSSALGQRMSATDVAALKEKYTGRVSAADINRFLQRLPRDMLFVMRSSNLVRSLNQELGGTSRQRFKIMGECAIRGLILTNASEEFHDAAAQFIQAQQQPSPVTELVADVPLPPHATSSSSSSLGNWWSRWLSGSAAVTEPQTYLNALSKGTLLTSPTETELYPELQSNWWRQFRAWCRIVRLELVLAQFDILMMVMTWTGSHETYKEKRESHRRPTG